MSKMWGLLLLLLLGCCFLAVLLGATLGCAQVLVLVVFLSTVTLLKLPLCHTSRTHAPLLINSRSTQNMGKHLKNSPEPHRGRKSLFQSCGNHFRTNCSSIWTTFEPHRICNSYYCAGISNRVRTVSNRVRTAWTLQFLLNCWDFEPCSNHVRTGFEPLSNRLEMQFLLNWWDFEPALTKRGVGTFKILKPQPPPPGRTEAPRILVQLFSEPPATKRLPVFWNNFSGPVACFWVLPPFRVVFFIPVALLFFSGCRRFGTTFPAP